MKPTPFHSTTLETDYLLFADEVGTGTLRHLVLVLDGDDQFKTAVAAASSLSAAGEVPPLLLVGIGYGGGYRSPKNKRARDYTPTKAADEPMETGGAPTFLRFLETELIPWLARNHSFAESDFTITGHSLGALFVAYTALQEKPLFRRCLASSASLWWDNRSLLPAVQAASAFPREPRVRLFLSVGVEDSQSMTGDLALFEDLLNTHRLPGLLHTVQRFPGLDHYTALPTGFLNGLRWLFK